MSDYRAHSSSPVKFQIIEHVGMSCMNEGRDHLDKSGKQHASHDRHSIAPASTFRHYLSVPPLRNACERLLYTKISRTRPHI